MSNGTEQRTQLTTIRDPFFGELHWDAQTDSYVASITVSTVGTIQISVRLEHEDPFLAIKDIRSAQGALSVILINEQLYRKTAAFTLVERIRKQNHIEGEIDMDAFISRMKLEAVSFYTDETALWYGDDNMFGGRTIYVTVNAERQFADVEIAS